MGAALLAGSSARISELLALRIEKHISNDRKTLYIRQQRKKDGSGVTDVLKTPAACRDIDLHSSIAKMLDDFIGGRERRPRFQPAHAEARPVWATWATK